MPVSLKDTLVIGVSATALFDLSEADEIFLKEFKKNKEQAVVKYREYMLKNENKSLKPGIAYPLIKALLDLNIYNKGGSPLVEVVIVSRNSPETGIRLLNAIREHKLNIERSVFTAGESGVAYLDAFEVDLFLTTRQKDAQKVIDAKKCAAAVLSVPPDYLLKNKGKKEVNEVRIAFDGDAVLFNGDSEEIYKTEGLDKFQKNEEKNKEIPMGEGPFAEFLKKLSKVKEKLPSSETFSPIKIALVTARGYPAELRAIHTLRSWGVYVDQAFFLAGVDKGPVLKAFNPHIFFDDQDVHLESAAKIVPSGKVLYPKDSQLYKMSKNN